MRLGLALVLLPASCRSCLKMATSDCRLVMPSGLVVMLLCRLAQLRLALVAICGLLAGARMLAPVLPFQCCHWTVFVPVAALLCRQDLLVSIVLAMLLFLRVLLLQV